MNYSNPRMSAVVENWPNGKHRVTARFEIEQHAKRGERAVRTTTGKPKALTYAKAVRIVDGDDGRIYIAELTHFAPMVSIMRGTMDYQQEVIHGSDERYPAVLALFGEAA